MLSMTGFGRGSASRAGNQAMVEISAVNNRKLTDVRFSLPTGLSALEPILRKRIQETVPRGALTVTLTCELSPELAKHRIRIDATLAGHVIEMMQKVAHDAGINPDIRAGDLLQVPGLLSEDESLPAAEFSEVALEALDKALGELRRMQEIEGESLRRDLAGRHAHLGQLLDAIAANADAVLAHHQARLHERIKLLGVELKLDDERFAKEVAFYAERSDITEEVVRLRSHLEQFARLIAATEPAGQALDFLCLEMNREISTIGAKTGDTATAESALAFKTDLGRIREQIQNVV